MKLLLLFLSLLTIQAQRTPFYVNGDVVENPDLVDTNGVSWTVDGNLVIQHGIWTVDTNGTIQATSDASGFPSLLISDTNNSPGFNINVGGSPYWGGQALYLSIGAPAPDLSTNASQAAFLVGIGDSVLGDTTITNSYHIYGIGDYTGNASVFDDSTDIFGIGDQEISESIFEHSRNLFALGNSDFNNSQLTNVTDAAMMGNVNGGTMIADHASFLYGFGAQNINNITITNNSSHIVGVGIGNIRQSVFNGVSDVFSFGIANHQSLYVEGSSALTAVGNSSLSSGSIINSSDFYAYGDGVMGVFSATNTIFVHGLGDSVLTGASLTNSTRIYALGYHTGENLIIDGLSDVMLFGSSTQPSQSHQMTWNVDAGSGTPYRLQMGLTNLFQVTDVGAIKTVDPAGGTSQAWKLGNESVVSTVTNLIVSAGSQKYRIVATPIP